VLRTALIDCEHPTAELLAGTLLRVVPDARQLVREHFAADPELRKMVLGVLRGLQERPAADD